MADRFLRWPEVHRITGLSRSQVWRMMKAGKFPKSIRLSHNVAGWRESEIMAWMDALDPQASIPAVGAR